MKFKNEIKKILLLFLMIMTSFSLGVSFQCNLRKLPLIIKKKKVQKELYLASKLEGVSKKRFSKRVREISDSLKIPPSWLMAVMHFESRLDFTAKNPIPGMTAQGLIQFTSGALKTLKTSKKTFNKMGAIAQLSLVHKYLDRYKKMYGDYKSITDLYLAVLYPKGRVKGIYWAWGCRLYKNNQILDFTQDGIISNYDLEKLFEKRYPTAYAEKK